MRNIMSKTQKEKVLGFLSTGKQITAAQARSRFGVQNLRSVIDRLRNNDGFTIYTNQKTIRGGVNRGKTVTSYRLADSDQEAVRSGNV